MNTKQKTITKKKTVRTPKPMTQVSRTLTREVREARQRLAAAEYALDAVNAIKRPTRRKNWRKK